MPIANDRNSKIMMPTSPQNESGDAEIYHMFLSHMRQVPASRPAIKILSAIQFTADTLNMSDAHVSKALVDMGLRAPRLAFPMEFLDYADGALVRCGWEYGAPGTSLIALRDYWFDLGEAASSSTFRHVHSIIRENVSRH